MRLTSEDLFRLKQKTGYAIASSTRKDHPTGTSPELEPHPRPAPLEPRQAKEKNPKRLRVLVTSYRRRLLDEDNLCEKYHVDCLRYAGIIPRDSPETTHIEVGQIKVKKGEERTEIEVSCME